MGNYYSDQVIEDVRSANSLVEIVSARVQLVKKGGKYFGLCPFHNEKTPSFSVDPDRQFYYCFSCNKGGDAFKFLIETEKITFVEALQRLAERAHIQLPASSDPVYNQKLARAKELQNRYLAMYAEAASFFSRALLSDAGKIARDYMQKRAIRMDMVKRFGLGYSYPASGALNEYLKTKGYPDDEQLTGGLISGGKTGGVYDRFRNRVIFPILDVSGRAIAFGGRALDDAPAKYLNSPETPYYSKGKHLYGLNLAKGSKEKFMLIVEGYMDLISLSARGIDNAVAPLGTALTDVQAKLLKRYTDDVVIAFDSDAAGQAAALRGLDILENQGFRVRVLTVPDGKDPDDFVNRRGAAAFRDLIPEALPLLDYKIASLRRREPDGAADGDVRFLRGVVSLLAGVGNEVEREIYINRIAQQYRISENSLKSEIDKDMAARSTAGRSRTAAGNARGIAGGTQAGGGNARAAAGRPQTSAGNAQADAGDMQTRAGQAGRADKRGKRELDAEMFVIALLTVDNSLWDVAVEKLPPEFISNENARQAFAYACGKTSRGLQVSPGELMRFFNAEESDLFAKIVSGGCHCEDNRRAMDQKLGEIRAYSVKRNIRVDVRALEDDNLTEEEKSRIKSQLAEHMKLFGTVKTLERINYTG